MKTVRKIQCFAINCNTFKKKPFFFLEKCSTRKFARSLNRTEEHEIGSGKHKEIEFLGHMRSQVKGPVEKEPLDWNA